MEEAIEKCFAWHLVTEYVLDSCMAKAKMQARQIGLNKQVHQTWRFERSGHMDLSRANLQRLLLPVLFLALTGCASGGIQPQATSTSAQLTTVEPTKLSLRAGSTLSAQFTTTPTYNVHPTTTRTGIPEVDVVIEAFLSGNAEARRELIRYTIFPCTSVTGLGGPPKCREAGVAEGTPVEYFPIMGPGHGQPMLREAIESWPDFMTGEVKGLYAVFKVPESDSSPDWPAGKYGLIFLDDDGASIVVARVQGGWIVRYDTDFLPDLQLVDEDSWVLLPPELTN